jgi:hypothetical protein
MTGRGRPANELFWALQVAKQSTFGSETGRLVELLAVTSQPGASGEQPSGEPTLEQTVEARLSSPLALDPDMVDSVPAVLGRPCPELEPLTGRSLGDVLTDGATSRAALDTIKEYGKALARTWEQGNEHAVAVLVYYAAIAAALTYHGCKITSRPSDYLDRALDLLAGNPGLTHPMSELLSRARALCRRE